MSTGRINYFINLSDVTNDSESVEFDHLILQKNRIKTDSKALHYNKIFDNFVANDLYNTKPSVDKMFINFSLIETHALSLPSYGLKIHISLDDTIPNNIQKGWNVIVGVLSDYRVGRAKVVNVARVDKDDPTINARTCGKQITLYACVHHPDSNWQNVLTAITNALLRNNISPGYRPHPDSSNAIKGNCYLSYRYDLDTKSPGHTYKPARGDGAFPPNVIDPFIKLNIPTMGYKPKAILAPLRVAPNLQDALSSSSSSESSSPSSENSFKNSIRSIKNGPS